MTASPTSPHVPAAQDDAPLLPGTALPCAIGAYAPHDTLSIVGVCMPPQEVMVAEHPEENIHLGLTPLPVYEDHTGMRLARKALAYLLALPPGTHPETEDTEPGATSPTDGAAAGLWSSKDLTLAVHRACEDEPHDELTEPDLVSRALTCLHAELYGLGALEALTTIPGITDIYVNSAQDVWVQAHGQTQPVTLTFDSEAQVRQLAQRLIRAQGGRLDAAHPAQDVHDSSGRRIHAVISPLVHTTHLSIRLPSRSYWTLSALRESGMFDTATERALLTMMAQRHNFIISGGTGTGKTTLLNALLGECEAWERLVFLEDTPELNPQHPHTVALRTRAANAEGAGEINLGDLLVQALRMAPDRLMVGECRGAEILHLLNAMNTGHQGAGTTLHANSAYAVPQRLAALGALAGLSERAVALHAATAFDRIVHLEQKQGVRRIAGIYRLDALAGELVVTPCDLGAEISGTDEPKADKPVTEEHTVPSFDAADFGAQSTALTDESYEQTSPAQGTALNRGTAALNRGTGRENTFVDSAGGAESYGFDPGIRTAQDFDTFESNRARHRSLRQAGEKS